MTFNRTIFREYDIRGVAERDFDTDFARRLGHAYAHSVVEAAPPSAGRQRYRVSVGRDCRLTSDAYADALRTGLREAGIDVVDLGICPTPLVYFSLFDLDLDGGIQVTGSHNPADHNGFKLCVGKNTLHGDQIQRLCRDLARPPRHVTSDGGEERFDIIARYQAFLGERFGRLPRAVAVVVDAGNATAGPVAPPIFRAMGCAVEELFCELDGRFPNHHPDPTVEDNLHALKQRVRKVGADLGVAFDGDADRLGVVQRDGRVVWGDELLILFARDVLARRPGATIVGEVKCSQRLFDDIAARGGTAIMWKAGHSPIKAKMRETHAALGGEMSGHMFFADRYFGYDDAIYAACRLLEILARTRCGIDELLADLPVSYSTPEVRVDCPDSVKFAVAEQARERLRRDHEVVTVDGVRVKLPEGWGLIRASNTQPALVLRLEATSAAALAEYRSWLENLLAEIRRELS